MRRKTWFRKASNGTGEIYSVMYSGENPRAIVHIVHGMSEHSGRYDAFARFLVQHGFVVVMEDHQGHGKSAQVPGHFGDENGWKHMLRDLKRLTDTARREFPALPVFMLGHSMGSFLARSYVTRYGSDLSGLVLSGTMGSNPAVYPGVVLAWLQMKLQGPRAEAKLLKRLGTGSYNRGIKKPVNASAWLCTLDAVCTEFEADPLSGVEFTAGAYFELFKALLKINGKRWATQVPDIPVYLFAGGSDPVGSYGKGPAEVYARLKASGHRAELKIYPGYRHEMLNEANKEQVWAEVLGWLNRQLVV